MVRFSINLSFLSHILIIDRNQKETLTQNYRRLGLASKLNHVAGGVEKHTRLLNDDSEEDSDDLSTTKARLTTSDILNVHKHSQPTHIEITESRVIRDATGAIISVVETNGDSHEPVYKPLDDGVESDEEWEGFDAVSDDEKGDERKDRRTETVRELEDEARRLAALPKKNRAQSKREKEWIERLIEKYGETDYKGMSRDRNGLNVMQQSEGDIRQRVGKYLKERGS